MLKKEPSYRDALAHSWKLVRSHKLLWLYGFFAAFLGQAGLLELATKVGFASTASTMYPNWVGAGSLFHMRVLSSLGLTVEGWTWLLFIMVAMLGSCLVLMFVSVVSQGALISSVAQSVQRRTMPHLGKAWHKGVEHFWRLFFINAFKKIAIMVLAFMMGWATVNVAVEGTTRVIDISIFFLVFILSIAVGLVVSFLAVYSAGYVVVEEYGLFEAIESAWQLFRSHWLVSIEVGLVILLLDAFIAIIAFLGLFIFFLPTLFIWFFAVVLGSYALVVAAFVLGTVLFTLFVMFLGAAFTAYTTTTWTYLFMKMHKHGMVSRILHWMR